jgi:ABC-2 type transport system permease protein
MVRRIWTLFKARNKEFLRDKSSLGWNILFPFLVIIGFSMLFSEDRQVLYKVGVVDSRSGTLEMNRDVREHIKVNSHRVDLQNSNTFDDQYRSFRKTKFIDFVEFDSVEKALDKLVHHRVDLLIKPDTRQYWVSKSSPKGYVVEKLLHAGTGRQDRDFKKESVIGREIPYVEWLFPGILGMNMMFSALFGVGYVVVRYRKNGVLKRMSVTPTKPYEFLTAQILSRMFLLMVTTTIVYIGCALIYGFQCQGSYLSLIFVFALGGFSMVSLGLLVAARSSSEEFAGGILNLITWPMMFLSEVWFSLEGARPWVQKLSHVLPLTHMIEGARRIMNDGAGLVDIRYQITVLTGMSVLFLVTGSFFFKWQKP